VTEEKKKGKKKIKKRKYKRKKTKEKGKQEKKTLCYFRLASYSEHAGEYKNRLWIVPWAIFYIGARNF
jgi:hypothetical protein